MRAAVLLLLVLFSAAPAVPAGDAGRQTAEEILAKPEYQRWRAVTPSSGASGSYDYAFLDTLRDWLRYLFRDSEKRRPPEERDTPRVRPPGADLSGLVNVVAYVILAALALFIIYTIYQWRLQARSGAGSGVRRPVRNMARALKDGEALAFDDSAWAEEARRRLAAGDVRQAYRALYLGLLSGLHDQRRIVFAPNRTNWQYVAFFRGGQEERLEFSSLTEMFDRVWYGDETGDLAGGIDAVRQRTTQLLETGRPA